MPGLVHNGPRVRRCLAVASGLLVIGLPTAGGASAAQLTVLPNGPATVSVSPAPLNGSSPECTVGAGDGGCTYDYPDGASVTMTPSPSGPDFRGWSPLECRALVVCTLVLDHPVTAATANYAAVRLSVATGGSGTVSASAAGIADCPDVTCDGPVLVPVGNEVTVTAASADTVHWIKGCDEGPHDGGTCTTTAWTHPTWVSVKFGELTDPEQPPDVLVRFRVDRGGSGNGTVSGQGLDCGSSCERDFKFGTRAQLVADPAAGSVFDHWEGACSGAPRCSFPIGPVTSIRAIFTKSSPSSANGSGPGSGTAPLSAERRPISASLRARVTGRRAKRRVVVTVVVDRPALAVLRLSQRSRVVARAVRRLHTGTNRVTLRLPRRARSGRYRLTADIRADGLRVVRARSLRLPR